MNVLITGKNGQLGSEIMAVKKNYDCNFIFMSSQECDITNVNKLEQIIQDNKINAIINCAAYTAVDKAEEEEHAAFNVNYNGVKNIDSLAIKYKIKYIHISTDYVFDGEKTSPYLTSDQVSPLGVYGRSKRAGEEIILNSKSDSIIIRTSWLYSSFGNNFVKTIMKYGREKDELGIVNDQFGSPTYARDLAEACMKIIYENQLSIKGKVYHYSNNLTTSWFEFTKEIFRLSSIDCVVKPITTDEYPTKTKRPKYSVLSTNKIQTDFSVKNRSWNVALAECMALMENEQIL